MRNLLDHITMEIQLTLPLDCILDEWASFDPDNFKQKKQLFYYRNMVWIQYELTGDKRWVRDRILNYDTILQLQYFCLKLERWSEMPCVQAFVTPYQRECSRTMELSVDPEKEKDILTLF